MISVRGYSFFQNYILSPDPNFYVNYRGRAVRLDKDGNIYDYSSLAEKGLSVNTEGQVYEINTGKIVKNIDRNEFILGKIE